MGEGITKVALLAFEDNEIGNAFWEGKGGYSKKRYCVSK